MAGSVWKQTCRSKVVSGRSEGHTGWHRVYLNVVYMCVFGFLVIVLYQAVNFCRGEKAVLNT